MGRSNNDDSGTPKPRFAIEYFTLRKIQAYANNCDKEISGFGLRPRNGVFSELVPLLPQVCTGVETEMPDSTMHNLAHSKYSARVNLWWHSHVDMGCFWSGQDEQAIRTLGIGIDMLYSIVVNRKNEYKARIDVFRPLRWTWDNIELHIVDGYDSKVINKIKAEIAKNVTIPQPKVEVLTFKESERRGGFYERSKELYDKRVSTFSSGNSKTSTEAWLKENGLQIRNGRVEPIIEDDPDQLELELVKAAKEEQERFEQRIADLNDGDGMGWH